MIVNHHQARSAQVKLRKYSEEDTYVIFVAKSTKLTKSVWITKIYYCQNVKKLLEKKGYPAAI